MERRRWDLDAVALRSAVTLRNISIKPWDYPDRATYQETLRRWSDMQPHNERHAQRYSVNGHKDQRKLEERLQRALERDDRPSVSFWLTALERSHIEHNGALPNEDTLVGYGAQIARTEIELFLEKPGDPTSRRFRQGVCVFYFDRWYEAYTHWYRWKERGGREALEIGELEDARSCLSEDRTTIRTIGVR